jgi:hypothetical protein
MRADPHNHLCLAVAFIPIEILNPPIDKQELYESKICQFEAMSTDYAEARRGLSSLFSSLQHRAFQGEL